MRRNPTLALRACSSAEVSSVFGGRTICRRFDMSYLTREAVVAVCSRMI
jgi:hypothetical protein